MYRTFGKRLFDLVVALPVLIAGAPFLLVLYMLVRIRIGAPAVFRQVRPGKHAKPFTIYKFRTMGDAFDAAGRQLSDGERLTRFGRFLRSTSLDELPELINVIRGDMSLVGPRPLLMEYLSRYNEFQNRRHEVRPGLTGWAQVNGRNAICWDERFALDVWYVDHASFWLDLKIMLATVKKLLKREGVNQPGHATVDYFKGNSESEASVSHD